MMTVNRKHQIMVFCFFPMLMEKTTLNELISGAKRDAQIMPEMAKTERYSVNIHHMEMVLQEKDISPRTLTA